MFLADVTHGERFGFRVEGGHAVLVRGGTEVTPEDARRLALLVVLPPGTDRARLDVLDASGYGTTPDGFRRYCLGEVAHPRTGKPLSPAGVSI